MEGNSPLASHDGTRQPADGPARKPSCADWVEGNSRVTLTDFQRLAVETLVEGFGTGVWNLNVNWKTVDWNYGRGVRFTVWEGGGLASTDFDRLTRLVLAAHDNCVRVSIHAASFRYFFIQISPRVRDGLSMNSHPAIEQSIAWFRRISDQGDGPSSEGNAEPKRSRVMDGRKLTVVPHTREEYDGSQALEWDVYDGPTYLAAFECEADATLFTQADALKRDNARMVALVKRIGALARSDGSRTFDDCISDLERIDDLCRAPAPSLEVREDG